MHPSVSRLPASQYATGTVVAVDGGFLAGRARRSRFLTSPQRGEVGLRSNPGEGRSSLNRP